jgi:hypothetical protein
MARALLCPVVWAGPLGLVNIMQRAQPLTESEAKEHRARGSAGFRKWPCACSEPGFEYKAADWGYLPDGRLVALDYATPSDGPRSPYDGFRECKGASEPWPYK